MNDFNRRSPLWIVDQRICLKNIKYNTMHDAKIIRITKHFLICQKVKPKVPSDLKETQENIINDDVNNNIIMNYDYYLYGNYSKAYEFGDLDDEYDDSNIRIHKNSTYTLTKLNDYLLNF